MNTRNLAAAVLALGLSACAAEFSPVGIYQVCSPPTPDTTSGACLYPATCDVGLAGTAVLDASTAIAIGLDAFRLPVQINNALTDNSAASSGRINTNDAYITSWEINYAGTSLEPRNVNAGIRVPTAGSSGALLDLIPSASFAGLTPPGASTLSIVVNIRGHGHLDSQDSFTTAWFQIPVQVCNGCRSGPYCAPGSVLVSCPSAPFGADSPGQTATVSCIAAAAARQ
jgi:hypothetical protein